MTVRPRALFVLAVFGAACLAGCEGKTSLSTDEETYPVRSDWLVVNVPSGVQPSKWYDPGYPPLVMLNRPFDTLAGDDALLVNQARNRIILNTRKVEPELRDEFNKVLSELFGTATEPRVPSGPVLIDHLKLEEKLAGLRPSFAAKQAEITTAKTDAKSPDGRQLVELLEGQAHGIANDIRNLETRLDQLHVYENDLKLDSQSLKQGGILYRNYCQQCHGLTGDGNGPGGRYLIPLPRDYRQGLFKFITTDPSVGGKRKPRREDLYRTITKGVEGSPMPQFSALKESELQAIISYVVHLSMRGETEYEVMKKAADPGADEMSREDIRKGLFDQAGTIAPLWATSARNSIVPDPDPYTTDEQVLDSAANGHALFNSPLVGCTTCHIGYGKSAPFQFDSWGSITRPRNLTVPTLRGGRSPQEIYARIYGGILGSNMPAHTHLRPGLEERVKGVNKIWDLVHFIQFACESEKRQLLKDKKQIDIE